MRMLNRKLPFAILALPFILLLQLKFKIENPYPMKVAGKYVGHIFSPLEKLNFWLLSIPEESWIAFDMAGGK